MKQPFLGTLWMLARERATTKKLGKLRRKFQAHVGRGLRMEIELYEMESLVVAQ